ncbi:MAG: FKBP-type peptidyl-prolyl cis-trans isomerase [Gammaproteobacteria bacterium]|nr:FKBP-type peptidyl-prolyl cis-trans isomerase [Gammaproteobacteria bacterium]
MAVKLTKGIELLDEAVGQGPVAEKGAVVTYNARIFLRRGDEVTRDAEIISRAREHLSIRDDEGCELIDHVTELGKRHPIAGIEKTLYGMRKDGYREVLVSPHLAYGEKGVPGLIPANALLRIRLWVRNVHQAT